MRRSLVSTHTVPKALLLLALVVICFPVPSGQAEEEGKTWTMPAAPGTSLALDAEKTKELAAVLRRDLGKVKTLECSFSQTRHSKLLLKPFRARGTFWHRTPTSLRWEITSPRKSVLLSDGRTAKRFKHFRGKWQEDKLVSSGGLLSALKSLSGWLDGEVPAKGSRAWKLKGDRIYIRMSPTTPALAEYLLSIDLLLTGQPWRISAVQLREKSGDRIVIRILDQKSNVTLPARIFTHVERP
jgi:outer membrane lipoprotein-sorting protein